jgi:hypothetical protein
MRKLSVLTVMALMAGTAFSAAVDVSDPPDIRLLPGAAGSNVFNLNNYYGTSNAGAPAFAGAGLTIANGVVSVPGAAAAGMTDFSISITVGGTAGNTAISRKVSTFLLAGGAKADANLYLTSQSANSNVFLNCLKAGTAKTSAVALTGGPTGGGSGSPGGGSPGGGSPPAGGASWYITFGTVNATFAPSGLLQRTSTKTAGPTLNSLAAGGLTASIDAAGQYTLSSDATFQGPVVVTFIKKAGNDMDSASVLASANLSVGANFVLNDLDTNNSTGVDALVPTGSTVTYGATLARNPAGFTNGKGLVVNAGAGQTVQIFFPEVTASGKVQVSVNTWALQAGAVISVAAVDPAIFVTGANTLTYSVQSGAAVAADSPRKMSVNFDTSLTGGKLRPVVQVVGPGTVEFDNLAVCRANPITRYALGSTKVGLISSPLLGGSGADIAGDLRAGTAGFFLADVGSSGLAYTAPVASTANNFATAGAAGSLRLAAGAGGVSNMSAGAKLAGLDAAITLNATAFAKKVSGSSGFLVLAMVSPGTGDNGTYVHNSALSTTAFKEVSVTASFQNTGGSVIVAAQTSDSLVADVDDISVSAVQDVAAYFDATLLGGL